MAQPTRMSQSLGTLFRRLCSSQTNPLLGVPIPKNAGATTKEPPKTAIAHFKHLPVSPKKLRIVANLVPRLYWKEAMAQMEFCRKNIAVMVKNCVDSAVGNACAQGLDRSRLIVESAVVNKGSYYKKPDFKAKMKSGIIKKKFSHLRITVREVDEKELQRTRYHRRWVQAHEMLKQPWAERVQQLPRYRPIPGYDPTGSYEDDPPMTT
mmetsp:Transcript_7375/g.12407  ORF Transcript_7375/g.12407 Transcript_7375/m.12407 type:complete len:208 (-) Transcript_7375:193-816(-)